MKPTQFDRFERITPLYPLRLGTVIIGCVNRFTHKFQYISFNAREEKLAAAVSPMRASIFILQLAHLGYRIAHTNVALQAFFDAVIGAELVEQLPPDAMVKVIENTEELRYVQQSN